MKDQRDNISVNIGVIKEKKASQLMRTVDTSGPEKGLLGGSRERLAHLLARVPGTPKVISEVD